MVKEKMHLQETTLFDLGVIMGSRSHWMLPSTLNIMWPMHQQSLILLHPRVFTRKYIIWPWPWVKVTRNVAQFPLYHVTYSSTKFEVATSNRLGGEKFTRKYIIWPWGQGHTKFCPVPSTSCDLYSHKVATSYPLGGETFTRNVTDAHPHRQTEDGPTLVRN